ncbi:hypothetical protein M514_23475 [Trichuris suis]|uniref:Reverse transcriptase domain-containing protein n=1 Tax=Trichuris suis TaxID=68888 RepID=A0A085N4B1_9BILA|nr:hypothetical protein M514_23475 [Trichuris suis]
MTVDHLRSLKPVELQILLNIWLFYRDVLERFKQCRTVLIPKSVPAKGPADYRPITIASVFYRLFTKIVSSRLNWSVELNHRQKGFIKKVDGCGENIFILNAALTLPRSQHRELSLATLDVAKAFDTISHHSIRRALLREGVSESSIQLITNLLSNSFTVIENSSGISAPIPLRRGVKQGDPMSPSLFSLVIDELLDDLDARGGGFTLGPNVQPNCLAFADDLLLSDSKAGLQSNLLACYRYFTARSLVLNVQKCCSLRLYKVPRCRTVGLSMEPQFYLDPAQPDTVLPVFTAADFLKYVGVEFNPFGRRRDQLTGPRALLDRVCKAELRPQQKIQLIRSLVLPRFLYTLTVGNPVSRAAAQIDALVLQAVKRILHLPVSTQCNDFIFLPKRHGGLGFTCLQDTADFIQRFGCPVRLQALF